MIITEPLTPEQWHAIRAKNVGASETACLFGLQAEYALSHYALWHVKAGRVPPPDVPGERPKWGLRLEEAIALAAQEQEGWPSISKIHYATDDTTPGLGCTPDYQIDEPGPNDEGCEGPGLLECKNVDWIIAKRSWTDEEPPPHILMQLQSQMACTGFTWGVVAGLVGGNDLRTFRYAARPKLIAEIRARVAAFWQSIRDGKEPPIDGSDGARSVLRAAYPEVEDDAVDLVGDNEFPILCAELLDLSERRKALEKDEAARKNAIELKLAGHRRAYGGGFSASVSIIPPAEFVMKRKESRRLSVKAAT